MPNGVKKNPQDPVITESNKLWARGSKLIPSGTQTLAKGPQQHVQGVAPKYLDRGKGSRVWDVDGNEYLDMTMGVGPLILGYGYEAIDTAIKKQLDKGITFSLMSPLEVELAEELKTILPHAQAVRFSKTGADACSAAIRAARAFTKRSKVLCCGYHGWHDWYISVTDRNNGIPEAVQSLSYTVNFNDLDSVREALDSEVACVILEPMVVETPKPGFLAGLKQLCEQNGSLLIFDEMWTGFRLALGGAAEYFGVEPDLATYSKAIANGMPISVLAGRHDVMSVFEKEVFFYTTFGGEALSLAASLATIHELRDKKVSSYLFHLGDRLKESFNEMAQKNDWTFAKCLGLGPRTMVALSSPAANPLEMKTFVQQDLIRNGILWSGFHNLSFSHSQSDVTYILDVYQETLSKLDKAIKAGTVKADLRGLCVEPVFRKTTQFNTKPKVAGAPIESRPL